MFDRILNPCICWLARCCSIALLLGLSGLAQAAAQSAAKPPLALSLGPESLAIVDGNGDLWRYGLNNIPSMQKVGSGFGYADGLYGLRKNGQIALFDRSFPWQAAKSGSSNNDLPAALRNPADVRHLAIGERWAMLLLKNGQLWGQPIRNEGKFYNPENDPDPAPVEIIGARGGALCVEWRSVVAASRAGATLATRC